MNDMTKLHEALTPEQMKVFDLLGPPSVVEGEDLERYYRFFAAIMNSVQPKDVQEMIYLRDFVDLEWDILRYRSAKAHLISHAKHNSHISLPLGLPAASRTEDALMAQAIGSLIHKLRRLDLMIESEETRRDRAYRELEGRRATLAKKMRLAIEEQAELHAVNDDAETEQRVA
jgi:hypothetical protein